MARASSRSKSLVAWASAWRACEAARDASLMALLLLMLSLSIGCSHRAPDHRHWGDDLGGAPLVGERPRLTASSRSSCPHPGEESVRAVVQMDPPVGLDTHASDQGAVSVDDDEGRG